MEGAKRDGETFVDASGKTWRADQYAGVKIAAWLLLRVGSVVAVLLGGNAELVAEPSPS